MQDGDLRKILCNSSGETESVLDAWEDAVGALLMVHCSQFPSDASSQAIERAHCEFPSRSRGSTHPPATETRKSPWEGLWSMASAVGAESGECLLVRSQAASNPPSMLMHFAKY